MENYNGIFTVPGPKDDSFFGEEDKGVVEDLLGTQDTQPEAIPEVAPVLEVTATQAPKKRTRKAKPGVTSITNHASTTTPSPKKRGRKPGTIMPKKAKVPKIVGKKVSAPKKDTKPVKAIKKIAPAPKFKGLIRSINSDLNKVSKGITKLEKALAKAS